MNGLLNNIRITNLMGDTTGTAAATTETPGIVDMTGWDSVTFLILSETSSWGSAQDVFVKEAATTAATFISLEAGGAVVSGAATDSTSRSLLAIEVIKPTDRYLQLGFTSGTVGAPEIVLAVQFNSMGKPVAPTTSTPLYDPMISGDNVVVATPSTA